ncbi:hypothetical protein [Streptomyces sp. R41]|uniref:Uncharacterized protein n=1 Tax=Streptomyces sp. R41 TaxID=3238632 RepID=A0AB39R6M0_9ACTN
MPSLPERRADRGVRTLRVKVLRYVWETGWSGARPVRPWPDEVFTEVFQEANGRSVRDFWLRSTLGRTAVDFDIAPWTVLRGGFQETLKEDRAGTVRACRRQAERDGVALSGFHRLIAFLHEPPSDTGLCGGSLVLDQGARAPTDFRREVGRLIGFGPVLDARGLPGAPYCVMGSGTCRAAAATLFAHDPVFRASSRAVRVGAPGTVDLTALGDASWHGGEPVLATVPVTGGDIVVEYRTDSGLPPAVVVHSVGVRSPGVRFEGALAPESGAHTVVLGIRVAVLGTSPRSVTLELDPRGRR